MSDKQQRICEAYFYKSKYSKQICRKVLNLKKPDCDSKKPDLTIIMLNPGSAENEIKELNKLVETSLDSTLHKIYKQMEGYENLNWVRVLNLFDVRNPKSIHFFKFLNEAKKANHNYLKEYSLFSNERKSELKEFIQEGDKIYLAWGTNKEKEKHLSLENVLHILTKEIKAIIINEDLNKSYHPLRRNSQWFFINKELFTL
jgi:hypothetical protein